MENDNYAIRINDVYKSVQPNFWNKKTLILEEITFDVKEGELFGFVGSNGAGKTTLIKCMLGFLNYTGSISFYNQKTFNQIINEVGFMSEQPYLYPYLNAKEHLKLITRFYKLPYDVAEERINKNLEKVGLTPYVNRKVGKYSKGMQQRLALAIALINEPKLLILDEPMAGLDPVGRKDFREIILEQQKKGCTVFFSTHILSDLETISDRIGIIKKGKLITTELVTNMMRKTKESGEKEDSFEDVIVNTYMAFE